MNRQKLSHTRCYFNYSKLVSLDYDIKTGWSENVILAIVFNFQFYNDRKNTFSGLFTLAN